MIFTLSYNNKANLGPTDARRPGLHTTIRVRRVKGKTPETGTKSIQQMTGQIATEHAYTHEMAAVCTSKQSSTTLRYIGH